MWENRIFKSGKPNFEDFTGGKPKRNSRGEGGKPTRRGTELIQVIWKNFEQKKNLITIIFHGLTYEKFFTSMFKKHDAF